jgi:hypothetical protein
MRSLVFRLMLMVYILTSFGNNGTNVVDEKQSVEEEAL